MPPAETESFGDLLRRVRLAASLSQEALAERAGLSAAAIAALERGRRTAPRAETARLLTDALGLSAEQRVAFLASANRVAASTPPAPTLPVVETIPPAPPLSPTRLIGREHEEAAVQHLLAPEHGVGARLVTLLGPGGVGKTRLALQVAAGLRERYADGVVFVDLSPIREPDLVPVAIAAALGIAQTDRESPLDLIVKHAAGKHLLLLLDNFEQVIEAAIVVSAMLAAGSRLGCLVTSRSALRLRGEQQFIVPPLAVPDPSQTSDQGLSSTPAVQLFVARARAIDPGFAPDAGATRTIAEICRWLDGLPLAIELAAARIRLLPPAALLTRLKHRLAVLTGGARDLPARQQALRPTIAWSHDLLSTPEQQLFAGLSIFAGGCTLEAAEAVCNFDGSLDVLEGSSSLLEKSLLQTDNAEEPRLRMLEIIREYALERLAASPHTLALQAAHARYYLALAERSAPELAGPEQKGCLARLKREQDNYRAALTWACRHDEMELGLRLSTALWRFFHLSGATVEGRHWLDTLLDDGRSSAPRLAATRAGALRAAAGLAVMQSDHAYGEARAREGLILMRAVGDRLGTADILNALGNLIRNRGAPDEAVPLYEESISIYRDLQSQRGLTVALNNLGTARYGLGQLDRAVELYQQSLALRRDLCDLWGIGNILTNLGRTALEQGHLRQAEAWCQESMEIAVGLEDRHSMALALEVLSAVCLARNDLGQATDRYLECLRLAGQVGDRGVILSSLYGLAALAARQDQGRVAAQLLGAAEALCAELGRTLAGSGQRMRDDIVAAVRAALDGPAFAAAHALGQALPREVVIEETHRSFGDQLSRSATTGAGTAHDRC